MQGYVPSIVVSRKHTAWFDERIYSAPLGRALHLEHMHARGLGFVVHPAAYIVEQQQFDDTDPAAPHEDELLDVRFLLLLVSHVVQHVTPCIQ